MSQAAQREEAVFEAALLLPSDQRAVYLDITCADDAELRSRVEVLLGAFERAGGFMKQPATPARTVPFSLPPTEKPGDKIGRYKLLEQIGEGGCGLVYVAEQEEPVRRRIALKVIKLGMDTKQVIARFDAERQALAMMDHPNIAKVLDAGATETGRPYFVMELVRGIKITDYCDQNRLSPRERLDLFTQVCRAIQHAHQKGVIHRDIKPSNILVTLHDGVPVPKVIDFGIAKATQGRLTDQTVHTAFEQFIGTPAYMSPEQAEMSGLDIDTRSDIYSLGVLLYELLTGKTPFDAKELLAAGLDEMRRTIREVEPLRPSKVVERGSELRVERRQKGETQPRSTLNSQPKFVSTDLDWIVMKCLEKDRTRRYETANGLATDIQRHLNNEAITARPPSRLYRFQKSVQRNKVAFGAVSLFAIGAVLAIVTLTVSNIRIGAARRAERLERQKSDRANRELGETVNLLELRRAEDFFLAGDPGVGAAHLAAMLRRDPSNHIAASRLVSALLHRNWALRAGPPMRHSNTIHSVAFSPDGRQVLTVSEETVARVWDAATSGLLATLAHEGAVLRAAYDPTGRRIVTSSTDGTARIWSAADGSLLAPPLRHGGTVYCAEFSQDGASVLTGSEDRHVRIWDAASGKLQRELDGHTTPVVMAHFSPDGQQIASSGKWGSLRLWNAQTGELLSHVIERRALTLALEFSPDGRRLAAAFEGGPAQLWDSLSGKAVGRPLAHKDKVNSLAFSPDGRVLLTLSQDGTARFWDAAAGTALGQPFVHEGAVLFAGFSADGTKVFTGAMDNSLRVWDRSSELLALAPIHEREAFRHASLNSNGTRLVTASRDGIAQVWDIASRECPGIATRMQKRITQISFGPGGETILATSLDGAAHVLDPVTGRELCAPMQHDAGLSCAEFSPDGESLVTGSTNGEACVWDWRSGDLVTHARLHKAAITTARFSHDGRQVLTASDDGTALVWNARNSQPTAPFLQHASAVNAAQFSPDGKFIATASDDRTARLWDAASGKPITVPLPHLDWVKWVEFSPKGDRMVTASQDNNARIWDVPGGRLLVPPLQHARIVETAAFSPDGRRVVTASWDQTARIWDAITGLALTPPFRHQSAVINAQFSPDGTSVITMCGPVGSVRLWDSSTGQPLTEALYHHTPLHRGEARLDPTGRRIAAGGNAGVVRIWEAPPVPDSVPGWFPAFAESAVGVRLAPRGNLEIVSAQELDLLTYELRRRNGDKFYERIARWFLADPTRRPKHPFGGN